MKPPRNPPRSDPAIDEMREARRRISARFDHDPERLAAYYMRLQEQEPYRRRLRQEATGTDTGRARDPAAA